MTATKADGKWHLRGKDTFDEGMNPFFSIPGGWESEEGAKAAAKAKLEEFKKNAKGSTVRDQVYIVRPDGSTYLYVDKLPVFIFQESLGEIKPFRPKVVCFIEWGVHITFTVDERYREEKLENVGDPKSCDKSCYRRHGHRDDFSEERRPGQYPVKPIIDAALAFRK